VEFPIWWYDLPMCMVSFLESYDLSGKTIVPFFLHNGSSRRATAGGLTLFKRVQLKNRQKAVQKSFTYPMGVSS
jgi:hypothetical protein